MSLNDLDGSTLAKNSYLMVLGYKLYQINSAKVDLFLECTLLMQITKYLSTSQSCMSVELQAILLPGLRLCYG